MQIFCFMQIFRLYDFSSRCRNISFIPLGNKRGAEIEYAQEKIFFLFHTNFFVSCKFFVSYKFFGCMIFHLAAETSLSSLLETKGELKLSMPKKKYFFCFIRIFLFHANFLFHTNFSVV